MNVMERNIIREQLAPIIEYYTPLFAGQGVKLYIAFRPALDHTTNVNIPRLFGNWEYIKPVDFSGHHPREQKQIYLVFILKPTKPIQKKGEYKEYAILCRTEDREGIHTRSLSDLSSFAKKLLARLYKKSQCQSPEKLCLHTFLDIIRYAFGPYSYKKEALGINLENLRLGLFLLGALIIAIAAGLRGV